MSAHRKTRNSPLSQQECLFCVNITPQSQVLEEEISTKTELSNVCDDDFDIQPSQDPLGFTYDENLKTNRVYGVAVPSELFESLDKQLQAVFIVRKLLDIPEDECANYLKLNGGKSNPNSWFSVCLSCQSIVADCYYLYREIFRIQMKLEGRKDELKKLVCESEEKERSRRTRRRNDWRVSSRIRLEVCKSRDDESQTFPIPTIVESRSISLSTPTTKRATRSRRKPPPSTPNLKRHKVNEALESEDDTRVPVINDTNIAEDNPAESDRDDPQSPLGNDNSDTDWLPLNEPETNEKVESVSNEDDSKDPNVTEDFKEEICSSRRCELPPYEKYSNYVSKGPEGDILLHNIPFYCDHCHMIYPTEAKLIRHSWLAHHSKPLHDCEVCQLKYITKQQLDIHMKRDHPNKCSKEDLTKDIQDQSTSNSEKCHYCLEVFPSILARDYHVACDHVHDLLTCDKCGVRLKCYTSYRFHRLHVHSNIKRKRRPKKDWDWRNKSRKKAIANAIKPKSKPSNSISSTNSKSSTVTVPVASKPVNPKKSKRNRNSDSIRRRYSMPFVRIAKKDIGIPFYCDHCQMFYTEEYRFFQHCQNYHKTEPLSHCDVCGMGTYSKQLLRIHQEMKHPDIYPKDCGAGDEEPSPCPHCSEEFPSAAKRDYHIASSHKEVLFICKICGFGKGWKRLLKEHELHHHMQVKHVTEKSILCDLCTRSFRDKLSLEYHQNSDHYEELGIDPFRCKYCGCTFASKPLLNAHENFTHKKIKKYFCEFCGKGFGRTGDLNQHLLLHNAPKENRYKKGPFFCQYCNAKFNVRQGLYYHLKKLHSDKYFYRCEACGKGYSIKSALYQHKRTCTGGSGNGT